MRKNFYILLFSFFLIFIFGCTQERNDGKNETINQTCETENVDDYDSEPTVVGLPNDTGNETKVVLPPHSELYLPGYTQEQIVEYFKEVILNVEYSDGTGSDDLVKKWLSPIYYRIYGTPTNSDIDVLNALCEQLNSIPGFPGIFATEDAALENVSINFLGLDVFSDSFSDVIHGEYAYGAAQFWYYTATNELHAARIGCCTDIDQNIRNSVLQEEIINILGISDTTLRTDSLTYQYSDENTSLSDVDLILLKLLYNPIIQCGFDGNSCAAIIKELYY